MTTNRFFIPILILTIVYIVGINPVFAQPTGINTYSGKTFLKDGNQDIEEELDEDDDEDEDFYNWQGCLRCHNFTDAELMGQIKRARNRHMKQKKENNPCSECHDQEEVVGICCHANYPKN